MLVAVLVVTTPGGAYTTATTSPASAAPSASPATTAGPCSLTIVDPLTGKMKTLYTALIEGTPPDIVDLTGDPTDAQTTDVVLVHKTDTEPTVQYPGFGALLDPQCCSTTGRPPDSNIGSVDAYCTAMFTEDPPDRLGYLDRDFAAQTQFNDQCGKCRIGA